MPIHSAGELHHSIDLSKPKVVFFSPYVTEKAVAVLRHNLAYLRRVVVFDMDSEDGYLGSEEFLNDARVSKGSFVAPRPTDIKTSVALILCSSGTTGVPKGVQLTQYNVLTAVSHTT